MDWRTALVVLALLFYVDGFSKYGRTCKDIGCLNSEVCVLAEDPCSFGRTSDCGTYPTCKKKSQVEGSHSEPAKPTVPKPQSPTRDFDSAPNYPAPAPPPNTHSGSPYDNTNFGGGSPYGGGSSHGGSPYGGSSNHGGSPYGGSPYGGSSSNGGSPYGGSSSNGGSPYGGSSSNGGSPYGGSPYGGNSYNGGGSPYGGSPYGGSSSNGGSPYGGTSPYGGSSNRGGSSPYGGSSSGGTGNGKSPLDSIFNTLNNFANGQPGQGGQSGQGSNGLSNIFGNILGNLSKSGGLNSFLNTRPIMENPNYSSYASNSRADVRSSQSNPKPSNYHNGATSRKPYGWTFSMTVTLTYLIQLYIRTVILN